MKQLSSAKSRQKGAVLALVAIGLVVIIAIAGFALDLSHAYVDKTRLQNALDAAALSGAMTMMQSKNLNNAEQDALATFNEDLETELAAAGLTPTVEFSRTLDPFTVTTNPTAARFVRVKLRDDDSFDMQTWLIKILGKNTIKIAGSAVAGPVSAEPCNLAPFVVCGDMDEPCFDPNSANPNSCYGFDVWDGTAGTESECYLKGCAQGGGDCDTTQVTGTRCGTQEGSATGGGDTSDVGTGSFYLTALDCTGANCLRDAFRDGVQNCAPDELETEPGVKKGPLEQAYNTKFNEYQGPISAADYPPDRIVATTSAGGGRLYFDEYKNNPPGIPLTNGKPNKRVMAVPIADCSEKTNGRDVLDIKAFGCFFATQPVDGGGNAQVVWGEFIGQGCTGQELSLDPTTVSEKIILYKDPDSNDS